MVAGRRALVAGVVGALLAAASAAPAVGAGTITVTNGTTALGATDLATLGAAPCTSNVGVRLTALGVSGEGVCFGSDFDGWGAADASSGVTGYVNGDDPPVNLATVSGSPDAGSTAVTIVDRIGSTLEVTHAFAPSPAAPNVYVATVTAKNISGAAADVRYRRTTDWDAQPTAFQERVTLGGTLPGSLSGGAADTNTLSTAEMNPLGTGRPITAPFPGPVTDNGPSDQGTRFDVNLGIVGAGQCATFRLYFGVAASEAAAVAAVAAAGIGTWALIESNSGAATGEPATWIAGASAPDGPAGRCPGDPVPAPAPAPAPQKPPAAAPPAALRAADVFVLPSAKRCISRRAFRIRLRVPAGVTAQKATVLVNGKSAAVVRGARLTAPINLKGLPKGKVTVKITLTTADGRTVRSSRVYRTCVPKPRGRR